MKYLSANFFRKFNFHKFLYVLLPIFILLTFLKDLGFLQFLYSEYGFFENIQLLIILSINIIQIKYFKILINTYSKFSYYLRIIIFSLMFYEELSFITSRKYEFANQINSQGEVNLHNLKFMKILIFENIPIFEGVHLYSIILLLLLFAIGFGNYLPFLKRYQFFILEKQLAFYTTIFSVNLFISHFLRFYNLIPKHLIYLELVELYLYILFLIDLVIKVNKIKQN